MGMTAATGWQAVPGEAADDSLPINAPSAENPSSFVTCAASEHVIVSVNIVVL